VCLQEVDAGQPRSAGVHQAREAASGLAAAHWRFLPALAGTPSPWRTWQRLLPVPLGPADVDGRPLFGVAVLSRRPVRRWHAVALGAGRARLPVQAPGPAGGPPRWRWVPDEPRVALAAELDGVTVVGTHLSFSPPTALAQLRRLRRWAARLPGPVVVAGDLNLPGSLPARLLGGTSVAREPTYPGADPRLRLDHVVVPPGVPVTGAGTLGLAVGDHRAVVATLGR
jgi:endonuclease/exonuclease/phosphatase family metal-dependent hydrolase